MGRLAPPAFSYASQGRSTNAIVFMSLVYCSPGYGSHLHDTVHGHVLDVVDDWPADHDDEQTHERHQLVQLQ